MCAPANKFVTTHTTRTHTDTHTYRQVCALIFWFYFGAIQLATVMDGDRQAGGSDAAWRCAAVRFSSVGFSLVRFALVRKANAFDLISNSWWSLFYPQYHFV